MEVYSVSQITDYLTEIVSQEVGLQDLWVEGEVAEVKISNIGHCYLTLKDERTSVRCVVFRSNLVRIGFQISPGMTLLAHGRANIYTGRTADLQLVFDQVQPSGLGGLYLAFEQLKTKLTAEGLFDDQRKRRPPFLPKRVALVTSESGAALRDALKVLRRRCPIVPVLLVHTAVQGETAAGSIVRALRQASARPGVEVILLLRGGGSIEDLASFNDEGVARAIRASKAPVIVGVGHETDFTIADFAADVRAPTPSAAAELAVPDLGELRRGLVDLRRRLDGAVGRELATKREQLGAADQRLQRQTPSRRLPELRQRLDERVERLERALRAGLERARHQLQADRARLEALSPMGVLARGYSLARDETGRVVISVDGLRPGQRLTTVFADGTAQSEILRVDPAKAAPGG
jgi:exodeoxyribonuclease VII large subunit